MAEDSNKILSLAEDTNYLLEDILLSGFHSVQHSSLEKIDEFKHTYSKYGMVTGEKLLENLYQGLLSRRSSFDYNVDKITDAYCELEFYAKNAEARLK